MGILPLVISARILQPPQKVFIAFKLLGSMVKNLTTPSTELLSNGVIIQRGYYIMSEQKNNSSQRLTGFRAFIPFYILYDLDLEGHHFRFYGQIEQMESNPDPTVNPYFSYSWMAKELGIGRRHAISIANVLRKKGYIERIKISKGKWRWSTIKKPVIQESVEEDEDLDSDPADHQHDLGSDPADHLTSDPADHLKSFEVKSLNTHIEENDFFLEKTLFIDSEQQRKAIELRKLCVSNKKAKTKHDELVAKGCDKTFIEVIDECVSHYATQQIPQLVNPQRLLTWLNREELYKKRLSLNSKDDVVKQKRREETEQLRLAREKAQDDAFRARQTQKNQCKPQNNGYKPIYQQLKEMGLA